MIYINKFNKVNSSIEYFRWFDIGKNYFQKKRVNSPNSPKNLLINIISIYNICHLQIDIYLLN